LVIGLVNHKQLLGRTANNQSYTFWHVDLVPFATLGGFPGLHDEWIVCGQGTLTTGTSTTIGNATPLHLLLGFVFFDADKMSVPTKTISGDDRALLLFSFSYPPLNKKHKITDQNE
jgi:hypothetical protein